MRALTVLVAAFALLSSGACVPEEQEASGETRRNPIVEGTELVGSRQAHPRPDRLVVSGESLIVSGGASDTLIYVFDRRSGGPRSRFGRVGEGPGEFRVIGSMQPDERGASIWVWDNGLGRMTELSMAGGRLGLKGIPFSAIGWFESVFWTSDSTLVGLLPFSDRRAVVLNRAGQVVDSFAPVPEVAPDIPATVGYQMYEPAVALSPSGDHLAMAARHAGRIDMYAARGGHGLEARVPVPFDPVVNMRHNGAMWLYQLVGDTRYGYIALAATDRHVYALFSGRTMRQCNQCAWFGNQVHVFTWAGDFVHDFKVDQDLIAIAVTPDSRTLYGATWEPEPAVFEFDLGGIR